MKCIFNPSRYSDADLEAKTHTIINNLTGNPVFTTPVPTLSVVEDASEVYSGALLDASTGNRSKIAVKNASREALVLLLRQLCVYVNLTANGNAAELLTSGFDVSKDPEPAVISKPENLKVENGVSSGELLMSIKKVKGAYAYLHEYTSDAAMAPASWVSTPSTACKIIFSNLLPGTKYYCRVGAIGANDQLLYSDTISRIVV